MVTYTKEKSHSQETNRLIFFKNMSVQLHAIIDRYDNMIGSFS